MGLPGSSDGKESACNPGNLGLIPGLGRSPGEGNGYPLQYSCLENPMDRGAWRATVHGVAESDTVTKQQGRGYVLCFRDKKLRFYKPLSNLFTHPLGSGRAGKSTRSIYSGASALKATNAVVRGCLKPCLRFLLRLGWGLCTSQPP